MKRVILKDRRKDRGKPGIAVITSLQKGRNNLADMLLRFPDTLNNIAALLFFVSGYTLIDTDYELKLRSKTTLHWKCSFLFMDTTLY